MAQTGQLIAALAASGNPSQNNTYNVKITFIKINNFVTKINEYK